MDRVPGALESTHGSDAREPRSLRAPLMQFDLAAEIDRLTTEGEWGDGDRNSIVLAKDSRLRVLLAVMRAGARIGDDDAEAAITVQVLGGRVTLRRDLRAIDLGDGHLGTIESGGSWTVEAVEDSAVLLTIAWPPERAAV